MNAEFEAILQRISTTLGQSDEAIPFRRGLRRHIRDLALLRDGGLTWDQIGRMLTSRGVRHKRGQVISSHQLRTVYAFLVKQIPEDSTDLIDLANVKSTAKSVMSDTPKTLQRLPVLNKRLIDILSTRAERLDFDE